ncbi:MAG: hypothetical protein WCT53_05595 [Candidatus Gracilibacteria bacterium]
MIFLQGVHHQIQHNGIGSRTSGDREAFKRYLEKQIKKLNIGLLAEEFNEECLIKSDATESTVGHVAEKLKIKHKFCDPNREEREKNGILSDGEIIKNLGLPKQLDSENLRRLEEEKKKDFKRREQFWFDKISDSLQNINVIFVCGTDHLEGLQLRFNENGIQSRILDDKF